MLPLLKTMTNEDPTLVFYIIILLLTAVFLWKTSQEIFSPLRNIPEPKRYWIFRHLPYFWKDKRHLEIIEDFCEQFKEKGIVRFDTFTGKNGGIVYLLKSDYVKTVLTRPDLFHRGSFGFNILQPLLGNALIGSHGDEHRFQKKFFTKAFSFTQMKYFVPVFGKHAQILTEIWRKMIKNKDNGENIIVRDYFTKMTLDAIGEISFGYIFNSQRTKMSQFAEAVVMLLGGVSLYHRTLFGLFPFMWYMPFGPVRTLKQAVKLTTKALDEVIQMRLKLIKEGNLTETQKNDLLSMMLIDRDDYFTDKLVRDFAFTFLFAGHETTATSLPGILMHLAKYPEMQEKVRNEINDNIHDENNIDMDRLNNMPYTDAFIKESLRLFTSVPVLQRVSKVAYKFGEYTIPKNTLIGLPLSFIQKNEFEKSNEFVPDRWLNGELRNGTVFTFGYGPMGCIGKQFALFEIKATLIHLMKSFRFTIDPGCDVFGKTIYLTLKIMPDLKIRVHNL